jgi:DNA-directed RNA polymerase specialized sigma24 family protein
MKSAPERLASAAVLHHVHGLKQGQVAKALGVCRRTVLYRLGSFAEVAEKFAQTADALADGRRPCAAA